MSGDKKVLDVVNNCMKYLSIYNLIDTVVPNGMFFNVRSILNVSRYIICSAKM